MCVWQVTRVVTVLPEGEPLETCRRWPLSRWHWYWRHLLLRCRTEPRAEYPLFQVFPRQRSSHKLRIQPPSLNQDHHLKLPTLKNIEYFNFYLISRIVLRWIDWMGLSGPLIITVNLLPTPSKFSREALFYTLLHSTHSQVLKNIL